MDERNKVPWLKQRIFDKTVSELRLELQEKISFDKVRPDFRSTFYLLTTVFFTFFSIFSIKHSISTQKFEYLPLLSLFCALTYYQYQFLLHEACHGTLFKNRKINDFFGFICGVLAGYDFISYRINHMKHHKFLGTDQDPENGNFINSAKSEFQILIRSFLLVDFCKLFFSNMLQKGSSQSNEKSTKKNISKLSSFFLYSFVALIYSNSMTEIFLFILVMLFSIGSLTFLINRYRGIKEHPLNKPNLSQFQYTVSHYKGSLINTIIAPFNFNFHLEHHLFPEVSSIYYPKINKYLIDKYGKEICFIGGFFEST
jgi:fatty acid desaturase